MHMDTNIEAALLERARQREQHLAEGCALQAQAEQEAVVRGCWQFVDGMLRCRWSWGAPRRYDVATLAAIGE